MSDPTSALHLEIKELIIDALGLEDISQKRYGIKIDADAKDTRDHFSSVASLAAFVTAKQAA